MRKRGSERWLRVRDLVEGDTYGEGQNFSVGGFVKIVASGGGVPPVFQHGETLPVGVLFRMWTIYYAFSFILSIYYFAFYFTIISSIFHFAFYFIIAICK